MPDEVVRFKPGETANMISSGEMKVVHVPVSIAEAGDLLGENFTGPEEIQKALFMEINPKDIPEIQFSLDELKRANELGHRLVLRVSNDVNGMPLTMNNIVNHLKPHFENIHGNILQEQQGFLAELFYTEETPRTGWSLVTDLNGIHVTGYNFIKQLEYLSLYLENIVYKDMKLPEKYSEAIQEFNHQNKTNFSKLLPNTDRDHIFMIQKLMSLKLTQLTTMSAVEAMYDMLTYFHQSNGKRLLFDNTIFTNSVTAMNAVVKVGRFKFSGIDVLSSWDDFQDPDQMFYMSRT